MTKISMKFFQDNPAQFFRSYFKIINEALQTIFLTFQNLCEMTHQIELSDDKSSVCARSLSHFPSLFLYVCVCVSLSLYLTLTA